MSLVSPWRLSVAVSVLRLLSIWLQSDVYHHCPAWTMAWHYRKRNLLKELLTHRPDIMCLQEVQSDHFTEFLQPELTKAGYMGIYKKKTTEIFTGRSVLPACLATAWVPTSTRHFSTA